jgi:antitoxin (DNA-binding transcriptional repressor) of toxin-antitoxin stability system
VRTLIGVSALRLPADDGPLADVVAQVEGDVLYLTRAGLPVARIEPVDPVREAERHMRENLGQIFGLAVRQRHEHPEPEQRLADLLDGDRLATADEYARFLSYLGLPEDLARLEAAETAAWTDDLLTRYTGSRDR